MRRSPDPARHARALRWAFGVGVAIVAAIALVLVFLLTLATNNRALYERNYAWLFGVNVVVALLLFAVLVWVAARLAARLRRGRFGSRLLVKLAAIFALVGLMPGLLIYVVSYQFVSRSIESWFDVRVEGALTAGVSLARATLETQSSETGARTRSASNQLAQVPDAAAGLVLERIRDQLGATDVVLWSASGQVLASTGQSRFDLSPERPSTQQLRNARQNGVVAHIEPAFNGARDKLVGHHVDQQPWHQPDQRKDGRQLDQQAAAKTPPAQARRQPGGHPHQHGKQQQRHHHVDTKQPGVVAFVQRPVVGCQGQQKHQHQGNGDHDGHAHAHRPAQGARMAGRVGAAHHGGASTTTRARWSIARFHPSLPSAPI